MNCSAVKKNLKSMYNISLYLLICFLGGSTALIYLGFNKKSSSC